MNEEIKEILDILKNCKDYDDEVFLIKQHSATLLLDYITNLQQDYDNETEENLKLSKWLVEKQQRIEGLEAENETLRSDFKNQVEYTNKIAEENERLKEENNNQAMNDYAHAIDESWYRELYDDYKSRCEKASGDIKDIFKDEDWYKNYDYNDLANALKNVLNILQNGSEEK